MPNKQITALIQTLTTERLFLFVLFFVTSVAIQAYNPDVYLHLTTGRLILESGALPHIDTFSFTRLGEPWVMHEWLYQILLYYIHESFGEAGLQLFGGGILTTVIFLNKKNCTLAGANNVTAWFTTIILLMAWMLFMGTRPHIITYLFFSLSLHVVLLYRHKGITKSLYVVPLIMVLWVNIHGGFIIGIVLLGYFTLLSFIERYAKTKQWQIPLHLFSSFILSILASLINPYGIEQLFFPFQLMDQWIMGFVPEWMPPDFTLLNYRIYAITVVFYVISSLFMKTEQRWFYLAFTAPFIIASLHSVRHIPIAAFAFAPHFAANIYSFAKRYFIQNNRQPVSVEKSTNHTPTQTLSPDLGIIENILNWVLLCLFITSLYFTYPLLQYKKSEAFKKLFPVEATNHLINNNIHGRMFTIMQYSDYILFHRYPEQKVFYDVRLETYGQTLSFDYMKMSYADGDWQELFKKYEIDYVVINKESKAYAAYAKSRDFQLIYEDKYNAIFSLTAKNGGPRDNRAGTRGTPL